MEEAIDAFLEELKRQWRGKWELLRYRYSGQKK